MSDSAAKRNRVLDAAPEVFGRYGYRRTSMDLLAQAAGLSRPALYQYFSGKEQLFRAMVERLVTGVLARAAEEAGRAGASLADRLHAVLAVKLEMFMHTVDPAHRGEVLADASVVAADQVREFSERYALLVESLIAEPGSALDLLGTTLSARDAARLLLDALTGIAMSDAPPEERRLRLRQLTDLALRGLMSCGHRP